MSPNKNPTIILHTSIVPTLLIKMTCTVPHGRSPSLTAALQLLVLLTTISTSTVMCTTHCPPCGKTQVPYPLSTSSTCGDQLYKIHCNSTTGTLTFPTLNNTYTIASIDTQSQRLIIQPSPFLPNTCITSDIASNGLHLDHSLPFNITSDNTIMFLNCSESLLRSPLNCSSDSLCHYYINGTREGGVCGSGSICCTFQAGGGTTSYDVRIREAGCRGYTSFVDLNDGVSDVGKWGEAGVAIQWVTPEEPVCRNQGDCDGNATCRVDAALSTNNTTASRRCYCNQGLFWDGVNGICAEKITCTDPDGCGRSKKAALVVGLTCGLGFLVIITIIVTIYYKRQRRIKAAQEQLKKEREDILNASGGRFAKIFTGKEIKKSTNNFTKDRLLGSGGFGDVYKGILDDGAVIAVKCAKVGNAKGTDQVLNEVRILCQVNHRSLVRLLGCCVELEQPLMVYEYISNGTLYDHLHGSKLDGSLPSQLTTWSRRLKVAYDTAEGLTYLHSSAVPPIYHRDVKSSNILLDDKLNAKVSDFGLSRLAETDMSHISTCAQGTLGYLDPEYYRKYQLTDKSDVYSFGVVLLELLTSQKAIDFKREADDVNLAMYVRRLVDEERLMDAIDPLLKQGASGIELDTMKALGFLAVGCLEDRRQNRPSMKEVMEEIEYIMSIAMAKRTTKEAEHESNLNGIKD